MSTRIAGLVPALILVTLFATPAAHAQAGAGLLDEIVVTVTPLADLAQPVAVLDDRALLLRLAPTLGETLERELGVSSTYFGPASSRPVIRGQSGSRVKVLTDGISTLDVSDISADHAVTIEPLLADSIEIIRGPATLLFGSSAAGGVVNVIDSRVPTVVPDDPVTGRFELRGDTAAREQAVVGRLDGGSGSLAWHLDAYDRETSDLRIAGFATADPDERSPDERRGRLGNSYSDSSGGAAGLSWITDRGYLGVGVSILDSTYGLPGPAEEEEEPGEDPALFPGPFLDLEQTRVDVRGLYRFSGPVESVKLAFGTNDYEHVEVEPSGEPGTVFDNEAWQLRAEVLHRPLAGWRGVVGLQVDDRDFSAVGEEAFVPRTQTETLGVFISEERDTSFGYLQFGGRVEALEHQADAEVPDYDETALSLAAGLAWDLSPAYRLTTQLSRTERNPAAEELYSDGPHLATRQFEIGLLAVDGGTAEKEVSTNVDVGIARRLGRVQWKAQVFYNAIDDYIFQEVTADEEDGLPVAPYTQSDARFYGAEAELTLPLLEGRAWRTSSRVYTDYVRAELRSGGGDLPRIPPLRAGVEVETARGPWTVGVDGTWHARQSDVSSFATGSFTMVNASVTYGIEAAPLNWLVFLRGKNLVDEEARRSTSFLAAFAPLPGRSLEAGVRLEF